MQILFQIGYHSVSVDHELGDFFKHVASLVNESPSLCQRYVRQINWHRMKEEKKTSHFKPTKLTATFSVPDGIATFQRLHINFRYREAQKPRATPVSVILKRRVLYICIQRLVELLLLMQGLNNKLQICFFFSLLFAPHTFPP